MPCLPYCFAMHAQHFRGFEPRSKGLRERNSPFCTLSQNGYGEGFAKPCGTRNYASAVVGFEQRGPTHIAPLLLPECQNSARQRRFSRRRKPPHAKQLVAMTSGAPPCRNRLPAPFPSGKRRPGDARHRLREAKHTVRQHAPCTPRSPHEYHNSGS